MGIVYNPARAPFMSQVRKKGWPPTPDAHSVGILCRRLASKPLCGPRPGHAFLVFLPQSFQGQRCACMCACVCTCVCEMWGQWGGAAGTVERDSSVLKLDALLLPAHLHLLCPHPLPCGPAQPHCSSNTQQSWPQGFCVCRCWACSSPRQAPPACSVPRSPQGTCCNMDSDSAGLGWGRVRIANEPCLLA